MDKHELQELEFAALLHDVGKIAIPKEILHKPAALTDSEFEVMKTHTIEGQFMLDRIGGLLGRVGEVVRSCHERWDGKGYPDGLKGEGIPLRRTCRVRLRRVQRHDDRPPLPRSAPTRCRRSASWSQTPGPQFDPHMVAARSRGRRADAAAADHIRGRSAPCSRARRCHARSAPAPPAVGRAPGGGAAPTSRGNGDDSHQHAPRRRSPASSRTADLGQQSGRRPGRRSRTPMRPRCRSRRRPAPWRCSGTTAWISSRSCTSSSPLPNPASGT